MSNSTPQAALPPLPEPAHRGPTGTGAYFDSYTAEQVEQIRRETVQACAEIARRCMSGMGAEAAILALLPVKEPKE